MIIEDPILGARFEERSVAEQNSLQQAFDLITRADYSNLRKVLFATNEDQERFRCVDIAVLRLVLYCIHL